ncbi:MAG: magnesium and cobalt transport protein CorA [Betaproteobacteria bacterium RIFCSPLOWO2_02_FULL_65_24]|nr:MAG: magnesium and cobalt transport protein CorA [Betaproteobacteria bacterium RIFCSPLOWO2_02_FULL_65_24]
MLINCAAYENGRKLADIPPDEISDYLRRPGCFVWVALADPQPEELTAMQQEFDLHELAVEDARHGHQRPKIEEYDEVLFAAIHTVEIEGEDLRVGEVDVFVGPNYVLSVRHRAKRSLADVRSRCEREPQLLKHGAGFVLYALMDAIVDRYFPVLDELEQQLERIEEHMFAGAAGRPIVEDLYTLKQKLMVLKHAVAPLLEAASKLHGGRVPQCCIETQDYFRDIYDHLTRINQSIDALREMANTATSVNLSLLTIAYSEITKRLAAYAALVAVPTMVAGVYGMNFDYMPELTWSFGYPLSVALMAVLDGYLFYRFRKAKWL